MQKGHSIEEQKKKAQHHCVWPQLGTCQVTGIFHVWEWLQKFLKFWVTNISVGKEIWKNTEADK